MFVVQGGNGGHAYAEEVCCRRRLAADGYNVERPVAGERGSSCAEEKRASHLNYVRVYVPLCVRLTT